MADQPNQVMTLREAVEMCDDFARHSGHPDFEASAAEMERWDRARAIVDALVNKYEDWCEWDGMRGSPGEDEAREKVDAGFREVRALERGEDAP